MVLNMHNMDKQTRVRRGIGAQLLLHFAREIYWEQLERGCHFVHEHPAGARSWADEEMRKIMADPRVGSVVGDQCQYGHGYVDDEGTRRPVRKATRWLSSAPAVLERLGHRCQGGHRHQALIGGRAAAAAVYPPQLCRAILRGAEAQRRRGGQALPRAVLA